MFGLPQATRASVGPEAQTDPHRTPLPNSELCQPAAPRRERSPGHFARVSILEHERGDDAGRVHAQRLQYEDK